MFYDVLGRGEKKKRKKKEKNKKNVMTWEVSGVAAGEISNDKILSHGFPIDALCREENGSTAQSIKTDQLLQYRSW